MHFIITKKELLNALTIVSHAIANFSPLPLLSTIKIDVELNYLLFTASNSDISIKVKVEPSEDNLLEIKEMGSILLEAKYINDIVRKLDGEIVHFESVDLLQILIKSEASHFKINGSLAVDYPHVDFTKPSTTFMMNKNDLKQTINQTIFATSDKENRPALTGVNFKCEGNTFQGVASDSYRLAKKTLTLNESLNFNIIVPAKSLQEMNKIVNGEGELEVAIDDKKIQLYFDNIIFQSRLVDGIFPDANRLIPNHYDYVLEIDYQELAGAIDRASFIKQDGVSVIKLSLSEEECELSSQSNIVGSFKQVLKRAKFTGRELIVSFNGKYVYDAIKAVNCSNIRFKLCGEMKPFVIESDQDESILQLVLPVKTSSY